MWRFASPAHNFGPVPLLPPRLPSRWCLCISDESELERSYIEEEKREIPTSLKEKQVQMERLVYRIWTYVALLRYMSRPNY